MQGLEMAPVLVLALDHLMHWTCSERHLEGRRIGDWEHWKPDSFLLAHLACLIEPVQMSYQKPKSDR